MNEIWSVVLVSALFLLIVGAGIWFSRSGVRLFFPELSEAAACTLCGAQVPSSRLRYYCTVCRDRIDICDTCLQRMGPENVKCARHVGAAVGSQPSMAIGLKPGSIEGAVGSYAEISPEVYAELTTNLQAAHRDLKALRQAIPCYLTAAAVVAEQLQGHLKKLQRAVGNIEIVVVGPDGTVWEHVCPLCLEGYNSAPVAGLCRECARDRGLVATAG